MSLYPLQVHAQSLDGQSVEAQFDFDAVSKIPGTENISLYLILGPEKIQ